MHRIINQITADNKRHKFHAVIEGGHKNVGDTVRIFGELKEQCLVRGISLLGTITIAAKRECLPLMVADFQAHASYLSEARLKAGLPGYFEMATAKHGAVPPPRGEAGLTQIEPTAASLRALKTSWEVDKQARIEKWRAERDARRAASSSASA